MLVEKEALGREAAPPPPPSRPPRYLGVFKRLGIDWEELSDAGHMRFGPEGTFVYDLICAYASQVVRTLGFPVYSVRGTNLFDLESAPVKEHAALFGQRMYKVESDGREYVMRYAACFQQFALTRHWTISHRHLPFGEFEIADSYRMEQSGELQLGFRLRRLNMPDMHVFCRDVEQAKQILAKVHNKIYEEIEKLGRDYYSLYNLSSREFFENNRAFFQALVERDRKPVLLAFYPEGVNYYWVLNVEYHIVDELGRPREIGTVQIDTGNAKRFGIEYTDADGSRRNPVILHVAVTGSVERWLYAVIDSSLAKSPPQLPLWLCPTQVRLVPVGERYVERALRLAEELNSSGTRCDVDDRPFTVGRKIKDSETSWIPYVAVVGEKELSSWGKLSVRVRAAQGQQQEELSSEQLAARIREESKGFPYRPLALPVLVSVRPIYSA